ncbi:PREDICTED: uncharacterized protein LOC109470571 [Branchiostoma belcheri]|uniref:Uncharacterized protein LOC109470571 n=1 Tax=Branchiostoma belcheri TaxID=7741 RepID=A0A6P4Y7U0_BRABE|nr:PREDICTED: uncharacterized protein LOC109470571 [Branchiostoma belcheri]
MSVLSWTALRGHSEWIENCSFSPDGRLLATSSGDETVRLWDLTKPGYPAVAVLSHPDSNAVWSCDFSRDGRLLCTCTDSGGVHVWKMPPRDREGNLKTTEGHLVRSFCSKDAHGFPTSLYRCRFSPCFNYLAACGVDRTIKIWCWREYDVFQATLVGHKNSVEDLAFAPDPDSPLPNFQIASCSRDRTTRLWTGRVGGNDLQCKILEGKGGPKWALAVSFSPDGSLLATCCSDGTVQIWCTRTLTEPRVLTGHTSTVWSGSFLHTSAADRLVLATCSSDRTVRLWDPVSGRQLLQAGKVTSGAAADPDLEELFCCRLSPDGRLLACCANDNNVYLANIDGKF